jgi:hypothetical protein
MAEQHRRTSLLENDPRQQQPNPEEIRNRAHEIYERRGREPGHDVDDWLEAERELREKEE